MDKHEREARGIYCMSQRVMFDWLWRFVMAHGPLPHEKLLTVIAVKRNLAVHYQLLIGERDPEVNVNWFVEKFRLAADKVAGITREGG